jgi:hypothetical protein
MSRSPNWQWSLQSMFGLVSACAVMAAWLRLRITVSAEWFSWWWISTLGILSLGFFAFWLLQCWFPLKLGTPRWEFLAAALLLSALDTAWGILSDFMVLTQGSRLGSHMQFIANGNAILGYGFIFSCSLAAIIAMRRARTSANHIWFFVLVAVVTVNVGLVVWFCNWIGLQMDLFYHRY